MPSNRYAEKFTTASGGLTDEVRLSLLETLYYALLCMRSNPGNQRLCYLLADHTHNIPGLLRDQRPVLLGNYYESIPHFIREMELLGQKVSVFESAWEILRQEHARIRL